MNSVVFRIPQYQPKADLYMVVRDEACRDYPSDEGISTEIIYTWLNGYSPHT